MDASIYKLKDIQNFKAMLSQLKDSGIATIDEALESINSIVRTKHSEVAGPVLSEKCSVEICQSCGRGIVTKWKKVSAQVGGNVYGCKLCQWSEVRK